MSTESIKKINWDKYNPISLSKLDLTKPEQILKPGNLIRAYSILYDSDMKQVGEVIPTCFYVDEVKHFPFIRVLPITKNAEVIDNKIILEFTSNVIDSPAKTTSGETVYITYMGFYIANTLQKIDVVALEIENNLKFIEKETKKPVKKLKKKKSKKASKND